MNHPLSTASVDSSVSSTVSNRIVVMYRIHNRLKGRDCLILARMCCYVEQFRRRVLANSLQEDSGKAPSNGVSAVLVEEDR